VFLSPLWGDLGPTYDDHLRLIGKRVVDFLLVLLELFSLGVTADALPVKILCLKKTSPMFSAITRDNIVGFL